jgi:ATP-dependent Clp protease ATP-binding subunit ClpX
MREDTVNIYGIEFIAAKIGHIEKNMLSGISRLLFLCVDISADQVKELVYKMQHDPEMDVPGLYEFLQDHFEKYREFLKDRGVKPNVIKKIEEWSGYFELPDNLAMDEMFSIFDVEESEILKALGLVLTHRIKGPSDIKKMLDPNVIGQEGAKRSLSLVFYLHLLRANIVKPSIYRLTQAPRLSADRELPKPVMVLVGPTGSGKTFIVTQLCKAFEVPFLRIDCASLVASGYVGNNINDTLYQFLKSLEFNIEKASGAIIYFDEFDKISESQTGNKGSVGGVELQQEFLSLIENAEKVLNPPRWGMDMKNHTLPLKNISFIISGSFAGMESNIEKRLHRENHRVRGYASNHSDTSEPWEPLMQATHEDLVNFGIIPELAGRVNFIVPLHRLKRDDIIAILKNAKTSPLRFYENFFYVHYDELVVDEEVYGLMADEILKLNTGARGIQTVLQTLLNDFLYECPDMEFKTYRITKEFFLSKYPPSNP